MGYGFGGTGTPLLDPLAQFEKAKHSDTRVRTRSGYAAFLELNYCNSENPESPSEHSLSETHGSLVVRTTTSNQLDSK